MYYCLAIHPPSEPLDNLSVKFSKPFLNIPRHMKLTLSLNICLHWDTYQTLQAKCHFDRKWSSAFHEDLFSPQKYDAPPSRLAPIMTATKRHLGDRITALQIVQFGSRLDDETLRIGVAHQVALNVCLALHCRCGVTVQSDGIHPLSCRFSAGRFPRQVTVNNIINGSLVTAGLRTILKPVGLEGRRPVGETSFPFKGVKALARDDACTDSFSASNLCYNMLSISSAKCTVLEETIIFSTSGRL